MTADAAQKRCKRPLVHSNTLRVRLQPQLCDAIIDAAVARGMTASEWVRQACRTVALLEGALFPDVRPDGKRRYARIEGGAIVDVAYLPDTPTPEDEPMIYALIRDGALVVPDAPFPNGGAITTEWPAPIDGCEWWPIVDQGAPTLGKPTYCAQGGTVVRTYGEAT